MEVLRFNSLFRGDFPMCEICRCKNVNIIDFLLIMQLPNVFKKNISRMSTLLIIQLPNLFGK